MRISTLQGDRFSTELRCFAIRLDGVEQRDVVTADTGDGVVFTFARDAAGRLVIDCPPHSAGCPGAPVVVFTASAETAALVADAVGQINASECSCGASARATKRVIERHGKVEIALKRPITDRDLERVRWVVECSMKGRRSFAQMHAHEFPQLRCIQEVKDGRETVEFQVNDRDVAPSGIAAALNTLYARRVW